MYGRDYFDNVSRIVEEMFDSYIRRTGSVEPLFTSYCDGYQTTCGGLSQWGTVTLAEEGLTTFEILQYYYGKDIEIVYDVPLSKREDSAPPVLLKLGSSGPDVEIVQKRLNRVSSNYPYIPKIRIVDGIYGMETELAVKLFQTIFGLAIDGVVGSGTWYKLLYIYNAVKRLSELNSEGLNLSEITSRYPDVLKEGSSGIGVRVMQYYLSYIAEFVSTVKTLAVDGSFGVETKSAVISFQKSYGLVTDGIVGVLTWDKMYNVYLGLVSSIPLEYREGLTIPFPGKTLKFGSEGDDVKVLQEYLAYISRGYSGIPTPTPDGIFGAVTEEAVISFQEIFGVGGFKGAVNSITWTAILQVYKDLYNGFLAS